MAASVLVSGVQAFSVDAFLPSGAEPGRFVVDAEPTANFPQFATFTFYEQSTTLSFPNCRLVGTPKVTSRGARAVYEDERWKLKQAIMPASFNVRGANGAVHTDTEKTVTELWATIAAASGLGITVVTSPDTKPASDWAGRDAGKAAAQLLERTVSTLMYDATAGVWNVNKQGSGTAPDFSLRLFREVTAIKPETINVKSSPNLYVAKVACTAKLVNSSGSLVDFGAGTAEAIDLWSGFAAAAADDRETYQASALRVWEPQSTTYPEAIGASDMLFEKHRLLNLCPSCSELIAVTPQAIAAAMRFGASVFRNSATEGTSDIGSKVVDGRYILCDKPVLVPDVNADISTSLNFAIAYAWNDGGELKRQVETRNITGGSGTLDIDANWITFAYSDLSSMPLTQTDPEAELEAVADSFATAFSQSAYCVRLPSIVDYQPSGQTGAVRIVCSMYPTRKAETNIALNYRPKSGVNL